MKVLVEGSSLRAPKEMRSGKGDTLKPLYGSTHTLSEYSHTLKRAPLSSHTVSLAEIGDTHKKEEMGEATCSTTQHAAHTLTKWIQLEDKIVI